MKLEVGKKYNCADGSIVTIANEEDKTNSNVFIGDNHKIYFHTGHRIGSGWSTEKDLISEYTEEDWIPKEGSVIWFVNPSYHCFATDYDREGDYKLIATGNYYQTQELCQVAADKKYKRDVITHKLEKLAKRLNAGVEIDWRDEEQVKYSLYYNYYKNIIDLEGYNSYQKQIVIYCLSENFKDEAIKEIGKDELESYLKGEM